MWYKIFCTAIKRNGWRQLFFYLSNLDVIRFIEFTKTLEFFGNKRHTVLEIGSGYSILPVLLSNFCDDYICIDISRGACKYQSSVPNVSPIIADMQHLPFKDEAIDMILAISSIEHVPDDRLVFKEISRISKNNAETIISIPYANKVEVNEMKRSKFLLNILYRFKNLWATILGIHLNYFLEQTSTDSFMKRYNLEEIDTLMKSNNLCIEYYYLYEKWLIRKFFKIIPAGWFILKDMFIGRILWNIEDSIDLKDPGGIILKTRQYRRNNIEETV